jgi:preprotein translocase subunit YajC
MADTNQAPESMSAGGLSSLAPMILIFVVFYFLLIRPQEKKRKAQEKLISTVKPGENIITHSGIFGKVKSVNENDGSVSLEVANNVELKVLKSAVADITSRKADKAPKEDKPAISKVAKAVSANKPAKKSPVTKPASKKPVAKKTAAKKSPIKKAKK